MTYQKSYNTRRGIILLDLIVGMSLATVFIGILMSGTMLADDIFALAQERRRLAHVYTEYTHTFDAMVPYEKRSYTLGPEDNLFDPFATTTLVANTKWYGNDRVQTDIIIFTDKAYVDFVRVERRDSADVYVIDSESVCSINFWNKRKISSYGYGSLLPPETSKLTVNVFPILIPVDPGIPPTDLQVRNGIAYIATDSSRLSDPDIFIVDIRNESEPQLLSGINTGPGISSIAYFKDRIYAAVTSTVAQLQIIRLDDLVHPVIETSFKLSLPHPSTTPPLASSIFTTGTHTYLGTEKWADSEFVIIDTSVPSNPVQVGSYEIGSKVDDVFIRGSIAYLATAAREQLIALNISDPSLPTVQATFSPTGWERQEGKSISYFEDVLDFGRSAGGFDISKDHELFSWGTTSSRFLEDSVFSANNPGGVYGIVRDRSYVYSISKRSDREFQIWDQSLATTSVRNVPLPALPQRLTCDGDSLYVLAVGSPVIYKIRIDYTGTHD